MADAEDVYECSCPGPPPPLFELPPPPPPPALRDAAFCSEMHTCDLLPVADAELQWGRAVPSAAVIAVGSSLLVAAAVVVSVLLWKYKRKRPVPILMPFKPAASQAGCLQAGANVTAGVPPAQAAAHRGDGTSARTPAPILLDGDKKSSSFQNGHPFMERPTVFVCPDPYSQPADIYNPIYQEVEHGSPDSNHDSRRAMAGSDEAEDDSRETDEPHYYTLRRYNRPHALTATRERRRAASHQQTHRSAGGGGRRHQQPQPYQQHRSLDRRRHRRPPHAPPAADDDAAPAELYAPVAALSYRPQPQMQTQPQQPPVQLQFSTFRAHQQLPQTGPGPPYAHTTRRAPHKRRRSAVGNSDLRLA